MRSDENDSQTHKFRSHLDQKSDPNLLVTNRSYRIFATSLKNQPMTFEKYDYYLRKFLEYIGMSPDEVCKLDIEELQMNLQDWTSSMIAKGNKKSSILTQLAGVEYFLDLNHRLYHRKALHKSIPKDVDVVLGGDLPFKTEEIQRMLEATTSLRNKAIILFFASIGGRPGVLVDPILRMKHIFRMKDDDEKDMGCYGVFLYAGSKDEYWAFLTPEASLALDRYHASRKRNGEVLGPESPVFASDYDSKHKHLTMDALYPIFARIFEKAGIERKKIGNRYDKAIVYGFRKRFDTILKNNKQVNSNIAEKLMAHRNGLDGHYYRPTREEAFAEFRLAIVELTISDDMRNKAIIAQKDKKLAEAKGAMTEVEKLRVQSERQADLLQKALQEIEELKKLKGN